MGPALSKAIIQAFRNTREMPKDIRVVTNAHHAPFVRITPRDIRAISNANNGLALQDDRTCRGTS